ncbi:MAG: hypothetical protein KKF46_02255, partial [Nanoarchaeota archaeon]|nr:hypothetical protein [Nanoarchaeota archaeon]MBU1321157.1 hypothetical protein [Nanoarchaeota archaeon]MBU1596957.1 hypothetical protein [Nanoarchaeota archaeon]
MVQPQEAITFFYWTKRKVLEEYSHSKYVNLQPYADEFKINLDECMKIVKDIVNNNKYFVGSHFYCTKYNVLPEYERTGKVIQDSDHIEGLAKIIQVHYGMIDDY